MGVFIIFSTVGMARQCEVQSNHIPKIQAQYTVDEALSDQNVLQSAVIDHIYIHMYAH